MFYKSIEAVFKSNITALYYVCTSNGIINVVINHIRTLTVLSLVSSIRSSDVIHFFFFMSSRLKYSQDRLQRKSMESCD